MVGLFINADSIHDENATDIWNDSETFAVPALRHQECLLPSPTTPSRMVDSVRARQNTTPSISDVIDTLATVLSAADTFRTPSNVWRVERYPGPQFTVLPMIPMFDDADHDARTLLGDHGSLW